MCINKQKAVIAGALLFATCSASASTIYNFSGPGTNGFFSLNDAYAVPGSSQAPDQFLFNLDDYDFTIAGNRFSPLHITLQTDLGSTGSIQFDATATSFTGIAVIALVDSNSEALILETEFAQLSHSFYGIFTLDVDPVSTSAFNVNPVPVPAAVWLFGSGLIGLIGLARRKKT